jgi:hypothetical protein
MPRWTLPLLGVGLAGIVGAFFLLGGRSERLVGPAVDGGMRRGDATSASAGKADAAAPSATAAPTSEAIDASLKALRTKPLPSALRREGLETVGQAFAGFERVGDDTARAAYLQAVLEFCLTHDADAAASAADALPEERWRTLGVQFVLLKWGANDPAAALEWARTRPKGEEDGSRFHTAYEGFASAHPMEALQGLRDPSLSGDWDELTRRTLFHCEQAGKFSLAREWIETLPEGPLRGLLIQQTVQRWATRSPDDAAVWLASVASEDVFRAGMGVLLQATAETKPQFAAGLTQQFADPEIRSERLADLIHIWGKRDLGGAAAWLRQQPPGEHLDAAIARLAETTAPLDKAEAAQWVNAIRNPQLQADVRARLKL